MSESQPSPYVGMWSKQIITFATAFAFLTGAAGLQNAARVEQQAAANATPPPPTLTAEDIENLLILEATIEELEKLKGPGLNTQSSVSVVEDSVAEPLSQTAPAPAALPVAPVPTPVAAVEVDGHSGGS